MQNGIPEYRKQIINLAPRSFVDASNKCVFSNLHAVMSQAWYKQRFANINEQTLQGWSWLHPTWQQICWRMHKMHLRNTRSSRLLSSDSTVALHGIIGNGRYKQFVSNRMKKIWRKDFITWRHENSDQNPADLGSRGWHKVMASLKFWF